MGYRAHVHIKHDIEYGNGHFNWASGEIHDWLTENGVDIYGDECNDYDSGRSWEILKDTLRAIPEDAYQPIGMGGYEITAEELREFVKDLLDAPTGDYAYVSWF